MTASPNNADFLINLERPPSLATMVASTIEEAIARGDMQPGTQIIESRMCEQLNVSRSTLREGLRLLQDRGLIDMIPHRGAVVTLLTAHKAWEIYTLRMTLESYAVRLTMEQGLYTPALLDTLHSQFQQLYALARQGSPLHLIEADMEFHRSLCSHCGHEMLLTALAGLRIQTRRFIMFTKLYHTDLKTEAETHQPIWDAVQSDDVGRAEASVRDHIREAGELLVGKMRALEAAEGGGKT